MQLLLHMTGINCDVCGRDPGPGLGNPYLWRGFTDADMGIRVCYKCRKAHYENKQSTEHAGKYSEVPVVVATARLNDNIK